MPGYKPYWRYTNQDPYRWGESDAQPHRMMSRRDMDRMNACDERYPRGGWFGQGGAGGGQGRWGGYTGYARGGQSYGGNYTYGGGRRYL
jgi:hypothetical protein